MKTPYSSFWMKNCIVPLDIIFIENGEITKIHHNCEPCSKCKKYEGTGSLVIEMPGGLCKHLNIKKGNIVSFGRK
jgi:uncharacterized membrane protein (UPF0127 family)